MQARIKPGVARYCASETGSAAIRATGFDLYLAEDPSAKCLQMSKFGQAEQGEFLSNPR